MTEGGSREICKSYKYICQKYTDIYTLHTNDVQKIYTYNRLHI
jgi:hypothetical protein